MKEKVGIGIIGTGFARKVQIPSFLECENVEIVSIASGHLENAESTAKEFSVRHFTDDWRETVSHADVDLVCITTPPDTHFEMTLSAIENGKHVLCEKPMAMNVSEAKEMIEKAKEKNVLALIDHELRFQTGRQKAFQMLRDGAIGKVRHAKYNFRNASRGEAGLPWTWWSDKTHGGGALGAIGSHIIDSFNWFLGTEISEVFCQLQSHIKQRKDENTGEMREVTSDDEANLILRFADSDLTRRRDRIDFDLGRRIPELSKHHRIFRRRGRDPRRLSRRNRTGKKRRERLAENRNRNRQSTERHFRFGFSERLYGVCAENYRSDPSRQNRNRTRRNF